MSPRILFVTLLNDVGSDRIVAAMGRSGCDCAVLGPADGFAAQSRFAGARFPLPRLGGSWIRSCGFGARFGRIVRAWRPDLVIPLDDFTARTLRADRVYRTATEEVRALIERSFGAPGGFGIICSRERQIALAAELKIRTPRQRTIVTLRDAADAAAAFGYPVVLKREQTCGGFGVAIVSNEIELARAFSKAFRTATMKRLAQTALRLTTADQNALVMQKYIAGPMAFRVVACAAGTVLDGISFVAACVNPPVTGASTVVRAIDCPEMEAAARSLVAALGCSGLVALDYILSAEGASLIEINPRPVASGHLGALYGHDIYRALVDAARGRAVLSSSGLSVGPERIALFPRELDRDPASAFLSASGGSAPMHDLPCDDPEMLKLYGRWLERRHPRRITSLRRLLPHGFDTPFECARPRDSDVSEVLAPDPL